MRRTLIALAFVPLFGAVGCHHDKYNLTAKFEEDYVLPPDEARFNNPPEAGYKRPAKKKNDDIRNSPGLGSNGGSALGAGAGGSGPNGFNSNGVPGR
ncbi:hypothetical protein [Limnoglobus roseus]|uniref:Uncharacterized protein n=1 Tax=Limnoglobus roseus TaxID=2598579 RepID=A0A5C1A9U7_9BACT|nr:hypothetical protein [Limnoglobus roseus]QEL14963.1 hypothetical protein PX52LOC_01866 [Limnoglobus roseus]